MKKLFTLVFAVALVFTLTACTGEELEALDTGLSDLNTELVKTQEDLAAAKELINDILADYLLEVDKTDLQDEIDAIVADYLTSGDKTAFDNAISAITDDYLTSTDKTDLQNEIKALNNKLSYSNMNSYLRHYGKNVEDLLTITTDEETNTVTVNFSQVAAFYDEWGNFRVRTEDYMTQDFLMYADGETTAEVVLESGITTLYVEMHDSSYSKIISSDEVSFDVLFDQETIVEVKQVGADLHIDWSALNDYYMSKDGSYVQFAIIKDNNDVEIFNREINPNWGDPSYAIIENPGVDTDLQFTVTLKYGDYNVFVDNTVYEARLDKELLINAKKSNGIYIDWTAFNTVYPDATVTSLKINDVAVTDITDSFYQFSDLDLGDYAIELTINDGTSDVVFDYSFTISNKDIITATSGSGDYYGSFFFDLNFDKYINEYSDVAEINGTVTDYDADDWKYSITKTDGNWSGETSWHHQLNSWGNESFELNVEFKDADGILIETLVFNFTIAADFTTTIE